MWSQPSRRKPISKMDNPQPTPFEIEAEDGCVIRGHRFMGSQSNSDQPTLLCLHGLASDCHSMNLLAERFTEAGVDVVAPDMRGHGLSDETGLFQMTPKRHARDAALVCRALGVQSVVIVTQSYAGRVGLELLMSRSPSLQVQSLHAFAPPWRARKASIKRLPRQLVSSFKFLQRLGRASNYSVARQPSRQPYSEFRDAPDFHFPLMVQEIQSISWFRYSILLLKMQLESHLRSYPWSLHEEDEIHLTLAVEDRYVSNSDLEELANVTGWPLTRLPCRHVSLMTNREHARPFAEGVLRNLRS